MRNSNSEGIDRSKTGKFQDLNRCVVEVRVVKLKSRNDWKTEEVWNHCAYKVDVCLVIDH